MNQFDNEDTLKNSGNTNLKFVKFQYEWEFYKSTSGMDEYTYRSPPFSCSTPTGTYFWFLELDQMEISLNLETDTNDEIIVLYNLKNCKKIVKDNGNLSYTFDKNNKKSEKSHIGSFEIRSLKYNDSYHHENPTNYTILFEGKCIVKTKPINYAINTFMTKNDLFDTNNDPFIKAIEDTLNFLYTGKVPNATDLHKGLLLLSDNLKLMEQIEDKLISELNIENAAEIYKFLYLHGKTDLNKKVMEFIKENRAAVMATTGWISIEVSSDIPMLAEIFSAFVNNSPRSNMDVSENPEVIATEKSPQEMS